METEIKQEEKVSAGTVKLTIDTEYYILFLILCSPCSFLECMKPEHVSLDTSGLFGP